MLYVENISALRFWLSLARVALAGQRLETVSSLEECPKSALESSWHTMKGLPCNYDFEGATLAVPDARLRTQRRRFKYHVWTQQVPPHSFLKVSDEVAVASPPLSIVQAAGRIEDEHLAQIIESLTGTYVCAPGKRSGMIDELQPLTTVHEIIQMAESLKGLYRTERILKILRHCADNSGSPEETNLLLLCSLPRTKGGLHTDGWEMNPELNLPSVLRRYLGQPTIKPDLLSRDRSLAIEYDSDLWHGTLDRRAKDQKRVNALTVMGFKVVTVRTKDVKTAGAFEEKAQIIMKTFGRQRVESTSTQLEARQGLIDRLKNNPWLSIESGE